MTLLRLIFVAVVIMTLVGCDTLPKRDPEFAPVQPSVLQKPRVNNGAIYQANNDVRLFEDISARRVGDVITVKLIEKIQAKKNNNLNVSKDNNIKVTVPNLLGASPGLLLGQNLESELTTKNAFTGSGGANQSNSLTGDIAVTVYAVLPNGSLKVRGEKRVTLNQGNEYIRLSGIIRPIDIDATNTVLSSKIADATIMYTGDGAAADASKPGWFSRFFTSALFPF